MSASPLLRTAQAILLIAIMAAIGYLADGPPIQVTAVDHTKLKVVVRYSGKRIGKCDILSDTALADKAPNMRQAMVCPREKSPIKLDLMINDNQVLNKTIYPSGIHNDGVLALYQTYNIPVGKNTFEFSVSEVAGEGVSQTLKEEIDVSLASTVILHFDDQGARIYQPTAKGEQ